MLIAGRLLAGIACGQILAVTPIHIAEATPPANRGFLVGLQGMLIANGFGVANWVGYACTFAKGDAQWRIPLAIQILIPALMIVAVFFLPYSPRWRKFLFGLCLHVQTEHLLVTQEDRHKEAQAVLLRLHGTGNDELATQEYVQITEQIAAERWSGQLN